MKTASIITEKIIAALNKGTVPWQKPFPHGSPMRSCGKRYLGINSLMLNFIQTEKGYTSPFWVTFNEAKKLGATVRPGEKSSMVVFWKKFIFKSNSDQSDQLDESEDNDNDDDSMEHTRFMLRFYSVFNACQCDDLPKRFHPGHGTPVMEIGKYQRADSIIKGYPNPPLIREAATIPCYSPTTDIVTTPPMGSATSPEAYYSTMFHELAHSTGHEKRLNRPLKNEFGSKDYAREELIAEMAACFLCAEAGIDPMIENSASYINAWLGALQKDHNLVVVAAGKAQHATDHILDRKPQTATTPADSELPATAGA